MRPPHCYPAPPIEQRRSAQNQGGFALIAVLAILGLFSLLIVAILSQTSVATNLTANQRVYVSTNRAAEGALEAATNELLRQTEADLEDQEDPCEPLYDASGDPFEIEVDGRTARVWCEELSQVDGGEFETLIPVEGGDVGRTVLVGSPDDNRHLPANGLARWQTTCGDSRPRDEAESRVYQPNCFPWADALDALWGPTGYGQSHMQGIVNRLNPTLAHSAPETLKFAGDVDVRGRVAAALNPARLAGPAINVAGEYRQGLRQFGPEANDDVAWRVNPNPSDPDADCRVLLPDWADRPTGSAWVRPHPDVVVNDVSGSPQCKHDDAAALRDVPGPGTTNVALPQPAPWTVASIATSQPTVPGCTAPTTELKKGAYPPSAMSVVNSLIATCNATIWFEPGDYWFGGDLNITNANARVVFGARNGWQTNQGAQPSHFPEACDPDADGVSITLRENATINHTAGRVAICNRDTGIDTAIQQNATGASEWIAPLTSAQKVPESNNASGDWAGVGGRGGSWTTNPTVSNLGSVGGGAAVWSSNCSTTWILVVNCNAKAGVNLTVGSGAPSPDRLLDSFTVRMLAYTSDVLTGWDFLGSAHIQLRNAVEGSEIAGVRIQARKPGGPWCTRAYQGLPNWGGGAAVPLAYDLLAPSDVISEQQAVENCWRPNFATQRDLQGAQVRVDFLFRARYVDLNPFNIFSTRNVSLTLDQLQVQAGWPVNATTASDGAAGVLNRDGGSISKSLRCHVTSCPTGDIDFTLENFHGSNAQLPASDSLDRVVLEVTGRNQQASHPQSAYTRATISVPGKGSCAPQVSHIPTFGQTFQIELAVGGSGVCGSVLQTPLDVMNAKVNVRAHMRCYSPAFARGCFRALGFGVGSISANIDHVRLVGFTTANTPIRAARVTSNATPAGGGATFYVDGDVSLTRRNLEVDWKGPAQEAALFNGDLILNGLASVATNENAEVGIVCCTEVRSTARRVVLTAVVGTVDPTVVSRSTVSISDVNSSGGIEPGNDVAVLDFNVCRSAPLGGSREQIGATECRTNVRSEVPGAP